LEIKKLVVGIGNWIRWAVSLYAEIVQSNCILLVGSKIISPEIKVYPGGYDLIPQIFSVVVTAAVETQSGYVITFSDVVNTVKHF
jgi:hypothetical protein